MKANNKNRFSRVAFLLLGFFLFSFPFVSAAPEYNAIDVSTPIFLILGIGSVLFLLIGVIGEDSLISVIGVVGILICGFLMMQGHILVPAGEVHNVTGNVTTITPSYDNWNDGNNELFGFFIIVACAGLGFTLISKYSEGD